MKLLMVGPTPEPYTGQSISFNKLKDSFSVDDEVSVHHVETSPSAKGAHVTGEASYARLKDTLAIFCKYTFLLVIVKPDVVYLTKGSTKSGFLRDLVLLIVKKFFSKRTKFVVHLKGGNYDIFYERSSKLIKLWIRYFVKEVDLVIVLGDSLVKMYDFSPEIKNKIIVVKNALPILPNSLGLHQKTEKIIFLYLSNLIYSKGYTTIIEAAKILHDNGVRNFEVVLAGEFMASPDDPKGYDFHAEMSRNIKNFNSNKYPYLKYVGKVNGETKSNLLREADILILPTNYHVEGQPVSIIEAMAYSCAIITTNYRSIPDIVDSHNALFIEFGNVPQLVSTMEKAIKSPGMLDKMKKASIARYESEHIWSKHYDRMKYVLFQLK
tara:strand:- start:664 stop:1803 length:1140 start_codon:yes stop_codon:yes gene_type:complete